MRKSHDFAKGRRGAVLSRSGKTRVTICIDNDVLEVYRERGDRIGKGYQTLINEALRASIDTEHLDATLLRKIVRQELKRVAKG